MIKLIVLIEAAEPGLLFKDLRGMSSVLSKYAVNICLIIIDNILVLHGDGIVA